MNPFQGHALVERDFLREALCLLACCIVPSMEGVWRTSATSAKPATAVACWFMPEITDKLAL